MAYLDEDDERDSEYRGFTAAGSAGEISRLVVAASADGIVAVDDQGIIRVCNRAVEELLARPARELIGAPFGCPSWPGSRGGADAAR
jgi:PAS domain-containing protein